MPLIRNRIFVPHPRNDRQQHKNNDNRHRYEFNNEFRDVLTNAGLTLSGLSPDGRLVETVELTEHPFFVGVQYHPEFKSRPNKAHPLFRGFIAASLAGQGENNL